MTINTRFHKGMTPAARGFVHAGLLLADPRVC
jgi:hypothetical protein